MHYNHNKNYINIFLFIVSLIIPIYVYSAPVSHIYASSNVKAQELFDKGLLNYYGYLYSQAEYDFAKALSYDSKCALCAWGIAITKKQEAIELNTPKDKSFLKYMLQAKLQNVYAPGFSKDIIDYTANIENQAQYLQSVEKLYQKYSTNLEALALYVDAIAYSPIDAHNTHTCSMESKESDKNIAIRLMRNVITNHNLPKHPGILHTYIHLAERDIHDPIGLIAAKDLPSFSNNEIAHYTHMPTHIYWRRALYKKSIDANLNTIKIDENYFKNGGIGAKTYYYEYHFLHSHHFLTVLGVLTNNFALSYKYSREIKKLIHPEHLKTLPDYKDVFLSLEHMVLARFEKWDEVLRLQTPKGLGEFGKLFVNYTKALAYLHKHNMQKFAQHMNLINKNSQNFAVNEYKPLINAQIKAERLKLSHATQEQINNLFNTPELINLEEKLAKQNPSTWFFPHPKTDLSANSAVDLKLHKNIR